MTREEKLAKFGEGPWLDEPDRVEFRVHGLPCLIRRQPELGFLCGYVAVPPEHPLHGIAARTAVRLADLEVHRTIDYGKPCEGEVCHVPRPGETDNVWWFGFHCGYGWDYTPGTARFCEEMRQLQPRFKSQLGGNHEDYRDLAYVRAITELLAVQLAAAAVV